MIMDITDNIKRIREEKRLSQAELSRRLNLDPSAYFRLEKRGNKLTLEQVENFAKALEVTPFELVGITPPETINDSNEKDVEIAGLKKRIGELERMNELFEGNAYILEAISRKFVNRAIDHAYGIAKHYSSIGHSKEIDREELLFMNMILMDYPLLYYIICTCMSGGMSVTACRLKDLWGVNSMSKQGRS